MHKITLLSNAWNMYFRGVFVSILNRLFKGNKTLSKIFGFMTVGAFVFVTGAMLLYILVEWIHMNQYIAYIIQAIYSIECNFALNYKINWRDREGSFTSKILKFHISKVGTVIIDQTLFALLTHGGVHYMVANITTTILLMNYNYFSNEYFVFNKNVQFAFENTPYIENYPHLGIVIPCRDSQETIEQMMQSLLKAADCYEGEISIYIVGSLGDPTWLGMENIEDKRIVRLEVETNKKYRDSNLKRLYGSQWAVKNGCTVIMYTDTRTITPPNTIIDGVHLFLAKQTDAVAGTFKRIPSQNDWWARVLDDGLITDVPHFGSGKVLNPSKTQNMPITACFFISADIFKKVEHNWPSESAMFPSHEDTMIAAQIIKKGGKIWATDYLFVYHSHRADTVALIKKWARAGIALANILRSDLHDDFSRNRLMKVMFFGSILGLVAIVPWYVYFVYGTHGAKSIGVLYLMAILVVGLFNAYKAKDIRAILYPFGTVFLMTIYTLYFMRSLLRTYHDNGWLLQIK